MIKGHGTVLYADGTEQSFTLFPIDLSRAERWLLTHGMPVQQGNPAQSSFTHALLLAHSALQREKQIDGVGFEAWADGVQDIAQLELVAANPTEPEPSDG